MLKNPLAVYSSRTNVIWHSIASAGQAKLVVLFGQFLINLLNSVPIWEDSKFRDVGLHDVMPVYMKHIHQENKCYFLDYAYCHKGHRLKHNIMFTHNAIYVEPWRSHNDLYPGLCQVSPQGIEGAFPRG